MAEKSNWTTERAFREYHDPILRYIRARVSSSQEAEDICSSVFLKVQSNISRYDSEKASFATWIYAIVRNAVADYYRLFRCTEPLCEETEVAEDISEEVLREERLEELASALEKLPQRECDLIILHYYNGMQLKEIASRMDISYSNIKRLHIKALASLRSFMSEP